MAWNVVLAETQWYEPLAGLLGFAAFGLFCYLVWKATNWLDEADARDQVEVYKAATSRWLSGRYGEPVECLSCEGDAGSLWVCYREPGTGRQVRALFGHPAFGSPWTCLESHDD